MSSWISCFSDRTFLLLYMHRFLFGAASAAIATFEYPWLLSHGVSLTIIFLYVAGYFFFSGIAALFATSVVRRLGIIPLFALAMGLKVIAAIMVSQIDWSATLALSSVVFSGATCGLYYSVADVLEALYVHDDARRGRQYTMGLGFATLGGAFGAVVSGLILSFTGFFAVAIMTALICIASLWFVAQLPKLSYPTDIELTPTSTLRFMGSKNFRPFWMPFCGEQLVILAQIFVPVYVFMALGTYRSTGFAVGGATILQVIVLGLLGHTLDRYEHRLGLRYASWLHAVSYAGYFLCPLTTGNAVMIGSASKLSKSLLDGAYTVRLHAFLRKTDHLPLLLFGSAYQATLCVWEVIVLLIVAFVTQAMQQNTIPLLLAGGMMGSFMQSMLFPTPSYRQARSQDPAPLDTPIAN